MCVFPKVVNVLHKFKDAFNRESGSSELEIFGSEIVK